MTIPKIILSRPKLLIDTQCPKCRSRDIKALMNVKITCKNCRTDYETDVKTSILPSIMKKIEILLSRHNEVWVVAERNPSTIIHSEDILKPRSRHEQDLYSALIELKNIKDKQRCWEVSDIIETDDLDYKVHCTECGYCNDCVTCKNCNQPYTPKLTAKSNEKRFSCPHCGGKTYKATYIKKFETKNGKHVCPFCKSDNVNNSKHFSDTKKCNKCGSTKLSKPRKVSVYKLIIKRQPRHWENGER